MGRFGMSSQPSISEAYRTVGAAEPRSEYKTGTAPGLSQLRL